MKLSFLHPDNGRKFSRELEDTIHVGRLISMLKAEKVLNPDLRYILKTASGKEVLETALFKNYKESDFIIIDNSNPSVEEDNSELPPENATFYQLGILVVDGSGSMTEEVAPRITRAEAVDTALKATFTKFNDSSKSECFLFSVVAFGDNAQQVLQTQPVKYFNPAENFNPLQFFNNGHGSNSTNIYSGLVKANDVANIFLNNPISKISHKVAIVLLSDGGCHHESETKRIADTIKLNPNIEIFCCHLEGGSPDHNAQNLLKYIVSSPNHYKTVTDETTIRKFFISSLSTASGVKISL